MIHHHSIKFVLVPSTDTEIDWDAYMDEVNGWLHGDWDYSNLRGGTGPLVYPAGFLYIFSVLRFLTNDGKDIRRAQYIFAMLYCAMIAVLFAIYRVAMLSVRRARSRPQHDDGEPNGGSAYHNDRYRRVVIPAMFALVLLCASRRIHSIFVLRLFNDGVAMLILYMAILAIVLDAWNTGVLLFSVALSVKMNILLFLPGLIVVLVKRFGILRSALKLLLMVLVQVVLAIPFLIINAEGYAHGAFDFGRKFFHIWTVNLKFLSEDVFRSDILSKTLLALHLIFLILFGLFKWCWHEGSLKYIVDLLRFQYEGQRQRRKWGKLTADRMYRHKIVAILSHQIR